MEETNNTNSEEVTAAVDAGTNSLLNTSMTPDDIIEAYKVLAQNVQDNTAREAARIGNAQRSLGTLAARVASPSGQTSGLANYTYDRTMRPTVDSTSKALITQGLAQGLQQTLSNALRAAKDRYENSRNSYAASGGGTGGNSNGNTNGYSEETDDVYWGGPVYEPNYWSLGQGWQDTKQWINKYAQNQAVMEYYRQKYEAGEISAEEYQRVLERLANGW